MGDELRGRERVLGHLERAAQERPRALNAAVEQRLEAFEVRVILVHCLLACR
jgi:hypothetical protein